MGETAVATPAKRGRKPKEGSKKKAVKSERPPTLQLVKKAIASDKDPKGTSVMAIKKHILAHHKVKSSVMLNHMLKRALAAGLSGGQLSRPKGQAESHLLVGRYRLASKEKPAVVKPKKATKPKAAKSPKKPAAKKAKSPKKAKKSPKKPAAKKSAAKKKTPKKAAKKA